MAFFLTSANQPAPQRKRKQVSNALEEIEEFMQIKSTILHSRMRPNQQVGMTMGPEEAKKLGYKFPWRAAVDTLRRFLKTNGLETDYYVRKYETDSPGIWAVSVTYDPPMVKTAVPHAEPVHEATPARNRARRSRTA